MLPETEREGDTGQRHVPEARRRRMAGLWFLVLEPRAHPGLGDGFGDAAVVSFAASYFTRRR